MGYDLIPVNKDIQEISFGAFSWPFMLTETGMGYILGYGNAMRPAMHVYRSGNNGSPVSNDGYKVTSKEAKAMALIVRGYISVQSFINKEWEEIPENEKEYYKSATVNERGTPLYKTWVHEDRLKQFEKFAEFAEKSKGFSIH